MSDQLERRVIELLARKKKLDPSAVTRDTTFEQLGMDSLDAADLLFVIEDTFGILVPDDVAQPMRTVGQVVDGIRHLVEEKSGAL
jgi:acyl carrier protein